MAVAVTREEYEQLLKRVEAVEARLEAAEYAVTIAKRLESLEALLKAHAYQGVPQYFNEILGKLDLIMEKLGIER